MQRRETLKFCQCPVGRGAENWLSIAVFVLCKLLLLRYSLSNALEWPLLFLSTALYFPGRDNLVLLLLELIFTISNGIPLTTSPSLLLSADPYPYDLLYNTCQSHLLHSHPQTNFSSQDSRKAVSKDWKSPKHVGFTLFTRSMSWIELQLFRHEIFFKIY